MTAVRNPIIPPTSASRGVCHIDSLSVCPSSGVSRLSTRAWSPAWYRTFIASYMMMIETTRHIANSSLQAPYLSPIAVESAMTKVECADGIPPLPNILANENRHFRAWTSHLTIIATTSDINGMMIVWVSRNVWMIENIYYATRIIEYSVFPEGTTTLTVSPVFLPMRDLPIGDSLLILLSRIDASWDPTIV